MDDLEKWLVGMEDRAMQEEPFRHSARMYSAMYNELTQEDPKVPQAAATQILVAHIDMLGVIGNGHNEDR